MTKTKRIYEYLNFFGFIMADTPETSFRLEYAKKTGKLRTLDSIFETKNVYDADRIYTYFDNRFKLKVDDTGHLIKG